MAAQIGGGNPTEDCKKIKNNIWLNKSLSHRLQDAIW